MKIAVLLLALFAQFSTAPQDVPLADPTPEFPLHVHLFSARYGTDTIRQWRSPQAQMRGGPGYLQPTGSFHGYGTGNLLGADPRGFDYSFDCSKPFAENVQPQDFYQARWKKQDQRLEILMQRIGSDHADICELKVALKPRPFLDGDPPPAGSGSSLSASNLWEDPDVAFTEPDPDYPVHLHVITNRRGYDRAGSSGYGTADIVGAPSAAPQGLDYTFTCPRGFLANSQRDEFFEGRWIKPGLRMEILTQRLGTDKVDRCQINVTMKTAPYTY
jgi:hypothetical protein